MKEILILILASLVTLGFSQQTLKGEIVDATTTKSITKAEIAINGEVVDVKIDKKGKFKIPKVMEKDVVVFSSAGYLSAQINIKDAAKVIVQLYPVAAVDEKVTDSFGSQSMRSVSSSVTVLKSGDFNKVIDSDIYAYLRGRVPGLTVIRDASNPTFEPQIMFRGSASLTGNYKPLIIVDGIQGATLNSIDPNDVASVTVLKDGSSQAMYGSQASGGVIIITTKKAKK